MATKINFIDIYSFYDELDANVIENLFEGYNISCAVRTFGSFRSPAGVNSFNEKRIAVEEDMVDNARRIIKKAIINGMISKDGKFRA